jgi:hypothetical protein
MARNSSAKAKTNETRGRMAREPSARDLIRQPHITASARLRFDCALFIKVTHPEYLPQEVVALVKQGQVQIDPLVPGQVGTLILDGFPYTVLGYYTFSEQEAAYEDDPKEYAFHMHENNARRPKLPRRRTFPADSAAAPGPDLPGTGPGRPRTRAGCTRR